MPKTVTTIAIMQLGATGTPSTKTSPSATTLPHVTPLTIAHGKQFNVFLVFLKKSNILNFLVHYTTS